MDSYVKSELPWDFGYQPVVVEPAFHPSLVAYEQDRSFVIDDPMVTAEAILRQRSVMYNVTAQAHYAPEAGYAALFPAEDSFPHEAYVTPAVYVESETHYAHDGMDVEYESDTSSAANTPREGFSLQVPPTSHAQEQELTPRDGEQEALVRTAFEKAAKAKRVKGYGLYRCPLSTCQRTYRRKGDLKVHCKKKHPDRLDLPDLISKPRSTRQGKAFLCPEPGCPCGFMRQRGLLRHYRKKHPEKANDPIALFYLSGEGGEAIQDVRAARMSERVKSIRAAMTRSSFSGGSSNSDDNSGENELRFTTAGSFSGEEDDDELYEESS
jgi:hypothetical protein